MDSSIENAFAQTTDLAELKSQIRKQAHENRRTQENKD